MENRRRLRYKSESMFVLKQFIKGLLLPPTPWIVLLLVVFVFWRRRWARPLLLAVIVVVIGMHSNHVGYFLRYPLESRYAPLIDPRAAAPYDAIVVLTAGVIHAGGLTPFSSIDQNMFRRLEEAWRLYKIRPRPIIVSGGHVNPFTTPKNVNEVASNYLIHWGVPKADVISEGNSRDTFESAVRVRDILREKDWKRYLLVTSALHMPRSMLAFQTVAPGPIPAPGGFTLSERSLNPLNFFLTEGAARNISDTLYEYAGLANYYWRARSYAN